MQFVAGYWLLHNDLNSCTAFIVFWVLKLNTLFNLFEIFRLESNRITFIILCKTLTFWCEHPWSEKKNIWNIWVNPEKANDVHISPNKQIGHFVCMQNRINLLANQMCTVYSVHCTWAGILVLSETKLQFQQCLQMKNISKTIFWLQLRVMNYNTKDVRDFGAKLSHW